MTQLGWKSVGLLELTALPSIDEERWVPLVRETDVLLAAGGDSLYLCHCLSGGSIGSRRRRLGREMAAVRPLDRRRLDRASTSSAPAQTLA